MRIVIVGGGFGGIKTAIELSKDKSFDITLISDKDYFLYYPALYGTATGGSHLQSVVPLSKVFKDFPRVKIVKDMVIDLDAGRRQIIGKSGKSYRYDKAVLAMGVVTTYFGIPGLAENSFGIKTIEEVKRFKNHLHDELVADKHMDKHYVIVGAGPTGVELSAALTSYLKRIAKAHKVKHGKIRIDLVEAAPRVLPRMSERTSRIVNKRLQKLGVQVLTNHKVEAASADNITINGKPIESKTIVWTSGVTNHPFYRRHAHDFTLTRGDKVVVDRYLQAITDVYVIGDNAATPYSGLAQIALHDAWFITKHLKELAHGQPLSAYRARKPPVVVPVGPKWAVFEWGPLVFTGQIASWVRRAADFIGYNDLLPIGQALGVWRAEMVREETCSICRRRS